MATASGTGRTHRLRWWLQKLPISSLIPGLNRYQVVETRAVQDVQRWMEMIQGLSAGPPSVTPDVFEKIPAPPQSNIVLRAVHIALSFPELFSFSDRRYIVHQGKGRDHRQTVERYIATGVLGERFEEIGPLEDAVRHWIHAAATPHGYRDPLVGERVNTDYWAQRRLTEAVEKWVWDVANGDPAVAQERMADLFTGLREMGVDDDHLDAIITQIAPVAWTMTALPPQAWNRAFTDHIAHVSDYRINALGDPMGEILAEGLRSDGAADGGQRVEQFQAICAALEALRGNGSANSIRAHLINKLANGWAINLVTQPYGNARVQHLVADDLTVAQNVATQVGNVVYQMVRQLDDLATPQPGEAPWQQQVRAESAHPERPLERVMDVVQSLGYYGMKPADQAYFARSVVYALSVQIQPWRDATQYTLQSPAAIEAFQRLEAAVQALDQRGNTLV